MHLGILQCGPVPPEVAKTRGTYFDIFQRFLAGRNWRFSTWKTMEMEFPDDIAEADAWLLTGSRHSVYEDHAFIPPLESLIRATRSTRIPMIGICFGHQIIAQALGGKVEKSAQGWGVGRQEYQVDTVGTLALTAWHQDQVTAPPPGARIIAQNAFCPNAGFVLDDHILTLQAHPELTAGITAEYIDLRRNNPEYPPGIMSAAQASYSKPLDTARTADFIAAFLQAALGPDQRVDDPAGHDAAPETSEKECHDV